MKRLNFIHKLIMCLSAICLLSGLQSCHSFIYDDQEPCPRGIRLKLHYDYNMKFADAFPAEVQNVSVFVFDPVSGKSIDKVHVPVGKVQGGEFEVNFDHLPLGKYDFLVWCYGESPEHFTIKPGGEPEDLHEHHTCLMSEDSDNPGHQSKDIGRLFHGRLLNADCTEDERIYTFDVSLVKNTNVARIVLQHIDGTYLNPDDFDITMTSDNGHMAHDNVLIPGHHRTYHPWEVNSGTTDMSRMLGRDSRAITTASALVAEHTIGRLVPETGVRLNVRNANTGEDIINIPFIDYALLVKGNYNRQMDDQEYLDRQDEYNMVFFLDSGLRWINSYIYINSWRIVLQHDEL